MVSIVIVSRIQSSGFFDDVTQSSESYHTTTTTTYRDAAKRQDLLLLDSLQSQSRCTMVGGRVGDNSSSSNLLCMATCFRETTMQRSGEYRKMLKKNHPPMTMRHDRLQVSSIDRNPSFQTIFLSDEANRCRGYGLYCSSLEE